MTMVDLVSSDCKLASPSSLQFCINFLGAGVDSNWSVYSASGLDVYVDLGIKLKPTTTAAAAAPGLSEVDKHDHPDLEISSRNLPRRSSFPLLEQESKLQAETEENAQSTCETRSRRWDELSVDDHDDRVLQSWEEGHEKESTTDANCSNAEFESGCDDCMCMKPVLLRSPSNILSQIECFDMADVSAACHLLELSSYSGCIGSSGREQSSTETFDMESPRHHFYNPSSLFGEVTQTVDRLQSALHSERIQQTTSWITGTKFHNIRNDTRTFSKRRVRANLVKQTDIVSQIYFDDNWDFEVDVLDRPPGKRRNRRVDIIYKRSIQV